MVVDHLNKSNNIRTLRIAGFLDNNPTAQFVIGEVWSKSATAITDKAKSIFEPNAKNFPEVNAIAEKPYEIEKALNKFKLNCGIKLYDVIAKLMKSNYSDRDKAILFAKAKASQFCNPPNSDQYPANLADKIEFTFYMKYILDTDYLVVKKKLFDGVYQRNEVPIQAIPGTKIYPKSTAPWDHDGQVGYRRVGQLIIDRINELYKDHYKTKYPFIDSQSFGERTSARILQRADLVLRDLSKLNVSRINQLRAASKAA